MADIKHNIPDEVTLPFVGRVFITDVFVHGAGHDMRVLGISEDGTSLRMEILTADFDKDTLSGIPADRAEGMWQRYDPLIDV